MKKTDISYTAGLLKSKLSIGDWNSSEHNSPCVEYLNNTSIGIDIIKEVLTDHMDYIEAEARKLADLSGEPPEDVLDLDFILFHIQQPLAMRKLPKSLEFEARMREELFYVTPYTK